MKLYIDKLQLAQINGNAVGEVKRSDDVSLLFCLTRAHSIDAVTLFLMQFILNQAHFDDFALPHHHMKIKL